jgi:outer membrane protein assembly factor BamB
MNLSQAARTTLFLLLAATLTLAEGTRAWEQSKFDDLNKGTAKGVAIRSTGGLELAPMFKPVFATPSTYIWSIAADASGAIYAASGAPARIYRVTPDGTATIIFEAKELQVQSIVAAKSGALYAATNPDGKIYKIEHKSGAPASAEKTRPSGDATLPTDANWTATVFFSPSTRYVWDLALDAAGNLFVATGDGGQLFKVTPNGEHSVFFKSDETHIRKLAFDNRGNLIAGSDGSGLVYRITPAGEAFVLYSAAKREITALAVDEKGNIYAAGVGDKRGATPQFGGTFGSTPINIAPISSPSMGGQPTITIGGPVSPMAPPQMPFPGLGATGGSEIYRIAPDGAPLKIWSSRDDIVYALAFDPQGRLLAGTGNRGHVFAINASTGGDYSDLLKATATQVTAFAPAPNGGLYAATSNLGKLFSLGAAPMSEGTYESDVFDARIFSTWGRAEVRSTSNVELFARTGNVDNPDRNWSPWKPLGANNKIDAPASRFFQWKAVLHSGKPDARVDNVLVNYLPRNVAPEVDDVTVQIGVHYQAQPKLPNTDIPSSNGQPQPHFEQPVPTVRDLDSIGVKWTAHDDNDDQLTYALYYRGDGESRWLLLKDNLTDKFYSFEASLLPDDGYTFKVVASDTPSHAPGDALTDEKESSRVEIDTTPPHIESLNAASEANGELHVTFHAVDNFSPIKRAEYSVDAGDWQFVEPAGKLSDAKIEDYDFRIAVPLITPSKKNAPAGVGLTEHVVVVRVYDRYDNLCTAKFVVRGR